jgi:hypothetical protein
MSATMATEAMSATKTVATEATAATKPAMSSPTATPIAADEAWTVVARITAVRVAVRVAGRRTIIAGIGGYADPDAESNARFGGSRSFDSNAASHQSSDCNFRQRFHD